MRPDERVLCRDILDQVCDREDHVRLLSLVPPDFRIDDAGAVTKRRGPLLLLDLMNVYRSAVPDLRFRVEACDEEDGTVVTRWSACGHHTGCGVGGPPTGRSVTLQSGLAAGVSRTELCGTWDIAGYLAQTNGTRPAFRRALCPGTDYIRLRAVMEREGTPVVLFPAMTLPGWMTWKRSIDVLRERRPVITFQLLANRLAFEGRGVPSGYCVRRETRAIERALEAAKIRGRFDVVGHSAGGTLALDFALENPDQVRSLTLTEPAAPWVLKDAGALNGRFGEFLRERIAACSGDLTEDAYAAFLQTTMHTPGYDPKESSHWPLLWVYWENVRFRPFLYMHSDSLRRVQSARFPVLLVLGTESDDFHREIIRVLRCNFRNCRSVELPGGHAPHYREGMARFLREMDTFHRECAGG